MHNQSTSRKFNDNYIDTDKNIGTLVKNIAEHYFGLESHLQSPAASSTSQLDQVIFVANHSGMTFPWDGILFGVSVDRLFPSLTKKVKALATPPLFRSRIMSLFGVPHFWRRVGCVEATYQNFERELLKGSNVYINPEGIPGIAKGFASRYQLQPFSPSYLYLATKYQIKIVPVYIVNAEYFHPYSVCVAKINRLTQKIGIPFLPLSPSLLLVPFLPFMFYFAYPTRPKVIFGEPVSPPLCGANKEEMKKFGEQFQMNFQNQLLQMVERYGPSQHRHGLKAFLELVEWRRLASRYAPICLPWHLHRVNLRPELTHIKHTALLGLIRALAAVGNSLPILGWLLLLFTHYLERFLGVPDLQSVISTEKENQL